MKYLGIDYGKKRVGIAISDEQGRFAFPHSVIANNSELVQNVEEICRKNSVKEIVVGESKDYTGKDNPVMKDIREFVKNLETESGLAVHLEPEFLTTAEAERIQGRNDMTDASAAAIILSSYINKK